MCKKLSYLAVISLLMSSSVTFADLVGHWPLDDGSGAVAVDATGNGHDGDLIDGPTWAEGLYGGALLFGGSPAKVDVPYSTDLNPEEFTASVWANPDPGGSGHRSPITSRDDFPTAGYIIYVEPGGNWEFWIGNGTNWTPARGSAAALGEWTHVAGTYKDSQLKMYVNGELDAEETGTIALNTQRPLRIGAGQTDGPGNYFWVGLVDDVAVFNHAMTQAEIKSAMSGIGAKELAAKPVPEDTTDDVLRDSVLSWTPGTYAGTHNVYFGTSFEDVNAATEPTAADLGDSSFDPGRLDFGQTYYWRVDEVNGTPDKTVFKGKIWSFTAEPYSIQIPGSTIAVTASSTSNEFSTPERTVDDSGLGADGAHAISPESMWFTASVDLDPWIQYEFEDIKQLDAMKVWNSNSSAEMAIGWGVKDVEIAYSTDGENWDVLADASQFSRASGSPLYNQSDNIAFGGVAAKYVRLNIASNWGGILMSYGLSEVQFYMIPATAREPVPGSGSIDVAVDAMLEWRAGREAGQHTIYLGTDSDAVADGSAPSVTSSTNSLDLGPLDLQLGETYYWRVDEVNEAEATPVWAGSVWSLSTVAAVVVEDFESYGNVSPDRPFQAWLDGFGYSADEFFSTAYGGNGTGAGIGHDIWSLSSPYYGGDIMETSNTMAGSGQSLPFYYANTGGAASETRRTFAVAQDWTVGSVKTLSIAFFGASGNTGQLYVKINDTKVLYDMEAEDITLAVWQAWNIDLSSLGIDLQSVTKLAIGVDGNGAAGVLLIDDMKLYAGVGEFITPVDPGTANLVSSYHLDGDFSDSTGNHNGTAMGTPQFISDPTRGQVLSLDGASSAADIPHSADLNPDAFTASLWVNADPTGTGHRSPLTSRDDGPARGYIIYAEPGNTWQFWIGTGAGWSSVQGPGVGLGEWTHLAVSYADELSRLYVNGILAGESTSPISLNGQQPLRLGGGATEGPGDFFFVGMIDEVRIYNSELSAGEALWLAGRDTPIHKPF